MGDTSSRVVARGAWKAQADFPPFADVPHIYMQDEGFSPLPPLSSSPSLARRLLRYHHPRPPLLEPRHTLKPLPVLLELLHILKPRPLLLESHHILKLQFQALCPL
ncbi:unnamed protein product [Closterium sp. Naga37s-1]|nr:unnamed protein product [Closterium sp. Naga37s-1]